MSVAIGFDQLAQMPNSLSDRDLLTLVSQPSAPGVCQPVHRSVEYVRSLSSRPSLSQARQEFAKPFVSLSSPLGVCQPARRSASQPVSHSVSLSVSVLFS